MNQSSLGFKKKLRLFTRIKISLILVLLTFSTSVALANEWTFLDNFADHSPGILNGQSGWAVTNYYGNSDNRVNLLAENSTEGLHYTEIVNHDSLIVSHDIIPIDAGIFQFKMRHDKSGLFYFYALTSDEGGQLLFSIQFTETKGILLEEANRQTTLLPDYDANRWYLFTIDFDGSRGERGTFKISIDDLSYGEYEYVDSESLVFNIGQIVFGSESNNESVSAFGGIQSTTIAPTSLTSDLLEDEITTVSIDGDEVVETVVTQSLLEVKTEDLEIVIIPVDSAATSSESLPEQVSATTSIVGELKSEEIIISEF